MSVFRSLVRWLQLKQYQLEVTFSVYIYTPVEKFIFWSVVFLLASLTFIATVLYLPQHIIFLINRAWFYAHGDSVDVLEMTKGAVQTLAQGALQAGATASAGADADGVAAAAVAGVGATSALGAAVEGATGIVREL